MSDDDKITVAENYCLACQGECTSDDPEDFNHLAVEFEGLIGAWLDRGVSHSSVWAFLATVLVDISMNNDLTEDETMDAFKQAWNVRLKHREEDE